MQMSESIVAKGSLQ